MPPVTALQERTAALSSIRRQVQGLGTLGRKVPELVKEFPPLLLPQVREVSLSRTANGERAAHSVKPPFYGPVVRARAASSAVCPVSDRM